MIDLRWPTQAARRAASWPAKEMSAATQAANAATTTASIIRRTVN